MIGRINDIKGQEVLVDAVAALHEAGVAIRAEIAGDAFPGAERVVEGLRRQIADRGLEEHIKLLGFVDDVASLLARSSIFVLPTKRPESFGLALVEAMAEGLPCIATDIGGPKEIVRPEVTGVLVPPGDAGALAEAILRLWKDPSLRERLGAEAAKDVRSRFTIEATAEQTVALYEELIAGRRRAR
jgi:glycosyltransferase involved in cell wall biosynthesis